MHYKKIVGDKVYLSPMDIENEFKKITAWVNEDEDIAYNNAFFESLISEEKMKETLQKWDESSYSFSIVNKENDEYLGLVSMMGYDPSKSFTTLGIFIGPKHRHQGFGSEAIKLLCDYAFKSQRLSAIHLEVFAYNQKAIDAYTKMGFVKCGTWHKVRYHMGEYHDVILMEMLRK